MSKNNGDDPAKAESRRVGAVLCADQQQVQFLGWGVYEGDFVPMEATGPMAEACRARDIPNPRIRLDSGKVVYGCECWWGDEKRVTAQFLSDKREVVDVDIDEVRTQNATEHGE